MKNKKILSLVMSVALLCTMFTVFGLSASAEGTAIEVKTAAELNTAIKNANSQDSELPTVINIANDINDIVYLVIKDKNIAINMSGNNLTFGESSYFEIQGNTKFVIIGSGEIRGYSSADSAISCIRTSNTSTVTLRNLKIFGGSTTADNVDSAYGIFLRDNSVLNLDNVLVRSGNSGNGGMTVSAIYGDDSCTINANNSTFQKGNGGSGYFILNPDFSLYENGTKLVIPYDRNITEFIVGEGYQNQADSNTITNTDGSPAKADTPVTANATIPAPTYTVTIPETVDFGSVNGALEKYRNKATDKAGENIIVKKEITVSAIGIDNLFDGKTLSVSIGALDSKTTITGSDKTINCSLFKGDTAYTEGSEFANFVNDVDLARGKENKQTGYVAINRCDITKTADYTGTMAFNITIKEAN